MQYSWLTSLGRQPARPYQRALTPYPPESPTSETIGRHLVQHTRGSLRLYKWTLSPSCGSEGNLPPPPSTFHVTTSQFLTCTVRIKDHLLVRNCLSELSCSSESKRRRKIAKPFFFTWNYECQQEESYTKMYGNRWKLEILPKIKSTCFSVFGCSDARIADSKPVLGIDAYVCISLLHWLHQMNG
jgi:hypothetical protein